METKQNQIGQGKTNLIREQIAQLGKSEISKHLSEKENKHTNKQKMHHRCFNLFCPFLQLFKLIYDTPAGNRFKLRGT